MLEHANVIKEHLEWHGPDEPTVRLSLTDDGFLLLQLGALVWRWFAQLALAAIPYPGGARSPAADAVLTAGGQAA
jgi:hypothetical protein